MDAALLIVALVVVGPGESVQAGLARAGEGERVVVRGRHAERVTISKRVELVGEDATLDGGGQGTVVLVRAAGTILRDLNVTGSGDSLLREDSGVSVEGASDVTIERVSVVDSLFGVHVKNSPRARVTGCTVRGKPIHVAARGDGIRIFSSPASRIESCLVEDVRDVIVWFSEGSRFSDNTVRRARYGLHLMNTADARCERNVIEDASVGIFSMYSNAVVLEHNRIGPVRGPSGYGIGLKETDAFTVESNVIGDARVGIYFDASPLRPDLPGLVRANHLVWCDTALSFMPSVQGIGFTGNAFADNGSQVEIRGGGRLSGIDWAPGGRGNFWSDYDGFDADGRGTGATPYRAMRLYESLVDAHADLALFEGSLAARTIDWGARVVPLVAPDPKVEDPHPLVAAPPLPVTPATATRQGSALLAAAGALGTLLAGLALSWFGRSP